MPSKKSTRAAKSVRAKSPLRLTAGFAGMAVVAIAVCVTAGGIIVAARQPSRPVTLPSKDVRVEMSPMPTAPARTVPASNASDNSSVAAAASVTAAPVTVAGCLAREGEGFRLKDTAGTAAPKARSWKSGFLKKGSTTVDVVDPAHTLNLAGQVGRRVSVTGALAGREMTARSLRRLGASCTAR